MTVARVNTKGARRWLAGHPWIYRTDVTERPMMDAGAVRRFRRGGVAFAERPCLDQRRHHIGQYHEARINRYHKVPWGARSITRFLASNHSCKCFAS